MSNRPVLSQATAVEILKSHILTHYKKFGNFRFEISDRLQEVVTEINGEKETTNWAQKGDYILTGASGEKYILTPSQVTKRYDSKVITNENGNLEEILVAKGECWGIEWVKEPFRLMAIWGEEMICNTGDMFVSPDAEISEAYRIEKDTFIKTYKTA